MSGLFAYEARRLEEIIQRQNRARVGNVYGGSLLFLVRDLVSIFHPILLLVREEDLLRIDRELQFLGVRAQKLSDPSIPISIGDDWPVILGTERSLAERRFLDHLDQLRLAVDTEPGLERVEQKIFKFGYHREYCVTEPLEFARRGGIIDLFPPQREFPIRIEFDNERIASIREFDPLTQRSIRPIKEVEIASLAPQDGLKTIFELFPTHGLVVAGWDITVPLPFLLYQEASGGDLDLMVSPPRLYLGRIEDLKRDLRRGRYRFKIFLPASTQIARLMDRIGEPALIRRAEFIKGELKVGFVDDRNRTVYLTETELFGNITVPRPKPRFKGLMIDDLLGMKVGDYVVHQDYGIGIYRGLTRLKCDQIEQECLLIEYAGGDKLYLSVEHINLVERYIGKDNPPISRLGGNWQKVKRNAKLKTERYVIELLDLYARRSLEEGISFRPDPMIESEIESGFGFELTGDQRKAIDDVYKDMERPRPMDRLVCGDVGYGKTEVALRAAIRAVVNGYQVAFLCPTTILALQHFRTFSSRLERFPFRVAMVSRLTRPKELRVILDEIATQKIDIVIGTHRILNPDVRFKNLGLLIIDDEHRFGVKQKELIKQYRTKIDVLMLTATPLPRTLYMALTGIRDISIITTPPVGRQDVRTEIMVWDDDAIRRIIWQEVDRNGQVFFIHNRIETIAEMEARLLSLLPGIRITTVHGQLKEQRIAANITDFIEGRYDLLLSTSIIEAGIDMPNVNTIVVDGAHNFGLADLHQLRGRVGRGLRRGYAYFLIPPEDNLSDEAKKRLSAISAYCHLGSGFRLAIRDMEIRGIGNILGPEQHGIVNRIGYGFYTRMLKRAIAEIQGKKVHPEPRLDLQVDAYIPKEYISDSYERIAIYKRLFSAENLDELLRIKDEIVDRFGHYPEIVDNLFAIAQVRLLAQQRGVESIYTKGGQYLIVRAGETIPVKKDLKTLIDLLSQGR